MWWFPIWLLAMDAVLRLWIGFTLLYKRRPAPVTLAWLVLLGLVPVISIFIFLLVGENRLGSRRLKRYDELTKGMELEAVAIWRERSWTCEQIDSEYEHIAKFGKGVSGIPPLRGNRLTLLPDNDTVIESIIKDIDCAQRHVHLLYYIWTLDTGGTRVAEAVIRAAQRGVKCRVLVDGVGSWGFINSELFNRMRAGGVQVVEALRVNIFRRPLARLDLRNHRKIAVMDGCVAYAGSQNIHDTSFRSKKWRKRAQWIDATVRVEGPAAQALAVTFLKDWQLDSDETLKNRPEEFLPNLKIGADADTIVQVIPSGPGPTPKAIHQAFLTMIYAAREELVMATPYFVPDEATMGAIVAAAARGVRVSLIMPYSSDSELVAAASRARYQELLEAGVNLYRYRPGLLHAKTMTIDGRVGLIGSANFDARSFFLNFEITLIVYDHDHAVALRAMQMGYLQHAQKIDLSEWKRRPILRTLADNAAGLFSPIL